MRFLKLIVGTFLLIAISCQHKDKKSISEDVYEKVILHNGKVIDGPLEWDCYDTSSVEISVRIERNAYVASCSQNWLINQVKDRYNHFSITPANPYTDVEILDTVIFASEVEGENLTLVLNKKRFVSRCILPRIEIHDIAEEKGINPESIKHICFKNLIPKVGGEKISDSEYPGYLGLSNDTLIISSEAELFEFPEDASEMFAELRDLKTINFNKAISTENTSNVSGMFRRCYSLTGIDISSFDFSNIEDIHELFKSCISLQKIEINGNNSETCRNFEGLFSECKNLSHAILRDFDIVNKKSSLKEMFLNCTELSLVEFNNFKTSGVENMAGMFNGCSLIRKIDVSHFDFTNCKYMNYMFYNCRSLTEINLGESFVPAIYTSMMFENVFTDCNYKVIVRCKEDAWDNIPEVAFGQSGRKENALIIN